MFLILADLIVATINALLLEAVKTLSVSSRVCHEEVATPRHIVNSIQWRAECLALDSGNSVVRFGFRVALTRSSSVIRPQYKKFLLFCVILRLSSLAFVASISNTFRVMTLDARKSVVRLGFCVALIRSSFVMRLQYRKVLLLCVILRWSTLASVASTNNALRVVIQR